MSTNCIRCVKAPRTGLDLYCDACRKVVNAQEVQRDIDTMVANPMTEMGSKYHDVGSCWELIVATLGRIRAYHAAVEKIRQCVEGIIKTERGQCNWNGCPFVIPEDLIEDPLDANKKASQ